MEKIIDAALGLIEAAVITGILGFGGFKGLQALHNQIRKETISALKSPTPSLSDFSRRLTAPPSH
ncbi:MAG: hypothetical protein JNL11_03365 [Bdellovibrionaceae bacterium]|nr:hypothetical protein [Pseudobdellovibrionaceae bacterium]